MTTGEKILILRRRRELTQGELAYLAQIAPNTVARIENGTMQDPGSKLLRRVAVALGVTVDALMDDEAESQGWPAGRVLICGERILPESTLHPYKTALSPHHA